MTQADSVHSTPPTNTSALPAGLFWQQRQREKTLKKLAKLRTKAAEEIERLIAFLDQSDPYAMTEQGDQVMTGPVTGTSSSHRSAASPYGAEHAPRQPKL